MIMSHLDMREKIGSIFTFSVFSDVSKDLMKLRMIKSNEEIEIIKNGARIADIGGEEIVKILEKVILRLKLLLQEETEWKERL